MRVIATVLAVVLSGSAALAQGDARENYGPVAAPATPKANAAAKPATKPKIKPKTESKAAKKDAPAPKPAPNPAQKTATAADKPATTGSANAGAPAGKPPAVAEAYAGIPLAERMAIQTDLTWSGDYTGPVDGEVTDRLADAVKAYQKRHKAKPTGVLTPQERAALATALGPRRDEVGWRVADDPVTGARVGIPGKLATKVTPGGSGTRWSSEQGQLQIETFRIDTGAALDAVFEQQKKLPRRRVTSSTLQPDSFVVSGMQGLKKMIVRGYARNGEVRGITILYDQAMEGTMDPLVAPMTAAFVPFAGYSLASANATEVFRRKVEYGSGLIVSASGYILTARAAVEGCQVITIPGLGNAERLAEDTAAGLALLRVYGARHLSPIGLPSAAGAGDAVTLVGIADPQAQAGGSAVSAAPAKLAAGTLDPAPALGFSGAAALDNDGHLLGMASQRTSVVAGAGAAPATMVPLEKIRGFLAANDVAPATARGNAEDAKSSVVRVICVRK